MQFITQLTKIINTGLARSVVLTGNIYDLFHDGKSWVPLMNLLQVRCKLEPNGKQKGLTQVVWQVNRQIEVVGDVEELERAWSKYHSDTKLLKDRLCETKDNSIYALEVLRQLTLCARKGNLKNNLLIIIEGADLLVPESPINHMSMADRKRVSIVHDWFSDPEFVNGHDTVLLLAEATSNLHSRISRLPQIVSLEVPLPDQPQRSQFFLDNGSEKSLCDGLGQQTAGLSIYAANQIVKSGDFTPVNLTSKVEAYMVSQLGEGVVEFKRPTHKLSDVVGFSALKDFARNELIPGFMGAKEDCIAGALVTGPIGGGKTYICEALASELGIPVALLKNMRSKWYGETDQNLARLKLIARTFYKIMFFVDEADAMFGDIGSDQDTERRLTGGIQAMMSDPELRGRVIWFLMTARPHRLSPDIRRPGRMDLIIPVLDPVGDDRIEFFRWTFGGELFHSNHLDVMKKTCGDYSAAEFGALRSQIKRRKPKSFEEAIAIAEDIVPSNIKNERRYQTLQAMVNCTKKSLIDATMSRDIFLAKREEWQKEIYELERQGIR